MSYITQIMCYSCKQALATVYAQAAPTDAEVAEFGLAGWQGAGWLDASGNWAKWVPFCAKRLYEGDEQLARTWVAGPSATYKAFDSEHRELPDKTCWIDVTGMLPRVVGDDGVSYCKVDNGTSLCGELWFKLATGGNHSDTLCGGC